MSESIKNILFIDCETTGVEPGKHSLIEVAAILYEDGQKTTEYHFFQPPNKTVNLGALKYNGVRIGDFLKIKNSEQTSNFGGFVDFLLDLPRDTVICGHNVAFDVNFIKAEADNYNLENLSGALPYKVLDTKTIAMFLIHSGVLNAGNTSLSGLAEALKVEYNSKKLHGAMYDARLTAEVYYKLLEITRTFNSSLS